MVGDSPLTDVDSILSRTSRPSITRPKTVYLPSSDGASAVTMKNEVVALALCLRGRQSRRRGQQQS